jgi:peptidoglycan/LPS O-acetylase OafA/YrhL
MRLGGFPIASIAPPWLFHFLFRNGNNGVSVFFAISGFLITSTSLRRFGALENLSLRAFYRTRFARIAPLLLLVLLVLSILHWMRAQGFYIAPEKATLARALFSALTFHLNWLEGARGYLPPNWDVLWSLSVEEVFYVAFPLVCLVTRVRKGSLFFIAVLLALVAAGPFARTWPPNEIWREKSYLAGMDGIALGCLAALLVDFVRNRRKADLIIRAKHARALQVAGFSILALVAFWPPWSFMALIGRCGLDGSLLALGTCLVAIPSGLRATPGRTWSEPIRWFGRNSYEVYMTHEFIVVWATIAFSSLHRVPMSVWLLLVLLVSGVLGAAVARFYSEPLNKRLRGQRAKQRPKAVTRELVETA